MAWRAKLGFVDKSGIQLAAYINVRGVWVQRVDPWRTDSRCVGNLIGVVDDALSLVGPEQSAARDISKAGTQRDFNRRFISDKSERLKILQINDHQIIRLNIS